MEFQIEWGKVQDLFCVIYMGLWVLVIYARWFIGLDIFFSLCISRLKKHKNKLEIQLSYFVNTLTPVEQEKLKAELALVSKDIIQLESKKKSAFSKNCTDVLQRRLLKDYCPVSS